MTARLGAQLLDGNRIPILEGQALCGVDSPANPDRLAVTKYVSMATHVDVDARRVSERPVLDQKCGTSEECLVAVKSPVLDGAPLRLGCA